MADPLFRLEFEFTEQECFQASRQLRQARREAARKPTNWFRPLQIAGIICSGAGMAILFVDPANWLAPTLLAIFGLFVPIYPLLLSTNQRQQQVAEYRKFGSLVWEFCENVVTFRAERQGGWWSWTEFERFSETTVMFLIQGRGRNCIIPKRAFANDAQRDEFRAFVNHKLSRPTGGFPVQLLTRDDK